MIGIIGAMDIEVTLIKKHIQNPRTETAGPFEFTIGKIHNKECVVCKCSIGKVNAAACTQSMILKYKPSFIINTGVAGAIVDGINIGDFVVAQSVVQHDIDTTCFGDPIGLIPGVETVNIPCSQELIDSALTIDSAFPIHKGIIATGDQFICDQSAINKIKENFNACACEMEGGSIGQVCYINNTPFLIIRAISDNANSHMDYEEFKQIAADRSATLIMDLIKIS